MSWRGPAVRAAALLMETLWVYALVALLVAASGNRGEPSLLGAAAVVVVSYTISRALQNSDLDLGLLRIWGSIGSLLLFYAIVRVDLFDSWRLWDFGWADDLANNSSGTLDGAGGLVVGVALLWAFWLRGVLRGQEQLTFESVLASFAAGVVVMVFVGLLARAADAPPTVSHVAVPYVALGLLTIGLTHAAQGEEDYGRSFAPTWLLAVGGAVLALTGIALLFVLIDLGTMTDAVITAGRALGWVVGRVIYYLLVPVFWVMETVMRFILSLAGGGDPIDPPASTGGDAEGLTDSSGNGLPEWARVFSRVVAASLVGSLIVGGLALLFQRYDRRRRPNVVRESTYRDGRLAVDLGGLVGNVLQRLRPSFGDPIDPARRLYFDLLDASARRGIERGEAQTPLELAPRLDQAYAAPTPGRITALFDDVRYGDHEATPEQVRGLREEWERLRREGG